MSLEDVECFLIKKAMSRYDGNVSQAARGAGPQPQRALSPPAALRAVTAARGRASRTTAARPAGARCRRCPAPCVALVLLWTGDHTPKHAVDADGRDRWLPRVGFALALRERVVMPLQTVANLLSALREGDFSIRGRAARGATIRCDE